MKLFQRLTWIQWFLGILLGLIASGVVGGVLGYSTGIKEREKDLTISIAVDITTQFELGMKDFESGNYDLAKQRFEYVILQNPGFPGAVEMLTETLLRLSQVATQTSDVIYPTATIDFPSPTPTMDTRAVDQIFSTSQEQWQNQDWVNLIQTIASLRDIDPMYRVQEVDQMLFLALHFSGIDKILNQGNLESGLYDLALVEKFAPLDKQARIYQEWARLYTLGVSFWGIFPEKSVYYFSQLAYSAPYLRDLSGIYAKDRYRMALVQYGDQLSTAGDWCAAFEQYQLAQNLQEDQGLQPTLTYASDLCIYGGETPTTTVSEPTMTIVFYTPTLESIFTMTPVPSSPTWTPSVTETPTSEVTPTPTLEIPTPESTPTESAPSPTPSPTTEQSP